MSEQGAPLTTYHEDKVLYKRHRAPRRVRRGKKRSNKLWLKQYLKYSPPQIFTRFYSGRVSSAANAIGHFSMLLYSLNGSAGPDDDILQMVSNIVPSAGVASTSQNNRLVFESGHMDITLYNSGINPAYIDCYYVKCRRETLGTPEVDFAGIQTAKWAGEGAVTSNSIGITPYNSLEFTKHWVIVKKRRILLSPSASTELSLADKKLKYYDTKDTVGSVSATSVGHPKYTSGILFTVEGASLDGTNHQPQATQIDYFNTRVYTVRTSPGIGAATVGLV